MDISYILSDEARDRGFSLQEPDDHILELLHQGKVIARFSQTGVKIENVQQEVRQISRN